MESDILPEYECNICLDLLIEPCTTTCGHSFCKLCLSKFLDIHHSCPICRKPIFQTKDTLSKSIILENIIKSRYPHKYQQLLSSKIPENTETIPTQLKLPAIHINNLNIWPSKTKKVIISQMFYYNTLYLASTNDRRIVVVPKINQSEFLCSLCEIVQLESSNLIITVVLKGIKRFRLNSFQQELQNNVPLFICTGELLNDNIIDNEETRMEIFNKINQINQINQEILSSTPISLSNEIDNQFGKCPVIPSVLSQVTQNKSEEISFYFLNIVKGESTVKAVLYECTNILERLDW